MAPFPAVTSVIAGMVIVYPGDGQGRFSQAPGSSITVSTNPAADAAGWQLITPPAPGSAVYTFVETAVCYGVVSGSTCGGTGEPCDPAHRPYFRQGAFARRGQIAKIVYRGITAGAACSLDGGQ